MQRRGCSCRSVGGWAAAAQCWNTQFGIDDEVGRAGRCSRQEAGSELGV